MLILLSSPGYHKHENALNILVAFASPFTRSESYVKVEAKFLGWLLTNPITFHTCAVSHCDLIDEREIWHHRRTVIDKLEPICLGTNINQSDSMHLDQVLLKFAGIFLHFQKHSKLGGWPRGFKSTGKFKALDQPMFILALVLNPFEGILHFSDKVVVRLFTLNTILLEVSSIYPWINLQLRSTIFQTYHWFHSWPPKNPHSDEEEWGHNTTRLVNEREVSKASLCYPSLKGVFEVQGKIKSPSSTFM